MRHSAVDSPSGRHDGMDPGGRDVSVPSPGYVAAGSSSATPAWSRVRSTIPESASEPSARYADAATSTSSTALRSMALRPLTPPCLASWQSAGIPRHERLRTTSRRCHPLGATSLRLRIPERVPDAGDEFHVGFAKTGRDGIGLAPVTTRESCDLVITNVIVLDPVDGIRVASIGIREGRISGIGRAGNPAVSDDVDVVVGSGTVVVDADGLIATPGGIDTHVHAMAPRVFESEIASGVTTVLAQEAGPVWGVGSIPLVPRSGPRRPRVRPPQCRSPWPSLLGTQERAR